MRLINVIFLASLLICKVIASEDFSSDDTVSVEAATGDDAATTVVYDDVTTTTLSMRGAREEVDSTYCVTTNGLSGTCSTIKECFPRLFPLDEGDSQHTPAHTGTYNPVLAKILLETSGFCGASARSGVKVANFRSSDQVCCASSKVTADFPLDNDTASVEYDNSCGLLKIDQASLPKDKIVGGREAHLGEFPWMVAMLRRGSQFCGASLLDSKNVLTAAHCVEFMTKSDVAALRLHIGDLDISSMKESKHVERKAKRVLYHKGFTMKNLEHDIALIHLDKPVEFSKTVQPVCLHTGSPPYDTGKENADVSGWGTTYSGGPQSAKLLTVNVNVITHDDCSKKYSQAKKKIGQGMVCAYSKGKDSCQGDSGGPLVTDSRIQAKQIGIVSWGIGCASYPGVYTRVNKYLKWINKNKQ